MSEQPIRAVLDTVVYVQNLISSRGPAAAIFDYARAGRFVLLLSEALLAEVRDVPLRPELRSRFRHLNEERVEAFVSEVVSLGVSIARPPTALSLPRDPKDEPLIDLAVAGEATYLVTWNRRHLTYLMAGDTPEGREFITRFPLLKIISPVEFLMVIDPPRTPSDS
jgi:uncharacterized protein